MPKQVNNNKDIPSLLIRKKLDFTECKYTDRRYSFYI